MASPLYDKLMEDLKTSMKAHDKAALNAIRGTIAKVKDLTVNAGKEIVDDVVVQVIAKGVKQRDESIAQFTTAGRADLAEGEKAEAALEVFEDPAFLKELVHKLAVREF